MALPQCTPGARRSSTVTSGQFEFYRQMAQSGRIVLRETQKRLDAPGGFGWDKWMGAVVQGVIARYDLQPGSVRADPTCKETNDQFGIAYGVASSARVVALNRSRVEGRTIASFNASHSYRPRDVFRAVLAAHEANRTLADGRR